MKTVVVLWNHVRHVREVPDNMPEDEVIRQVIAESPQGKGAEPAAKPAANPELEKTTLAQVPEPEKKAFAEIVAEGTGWWSVRVNGKGVGGKAMRKAEAEAMARQLNLTKVNADKPWVIGQKKPPPAA